MRPLTDRDKRTLRLAGAVIAVYLALFYGAGAWKQLEAKRAEYRRLVRQAEELRRQFDRYENRALVVEKLRQTMRMNPAQWSKATLLAEASAAIQQAAARGGVQLGPMRESPPHAAAGELASVQLEGVGPVMAVLAWLSRLDTLGYPLVIDSVQFSAEPSRPGMLKANLTVVILDFEQAPKEERGHA